VSTSSGPGGANVWFQWKGIAELVQQFKGLAFDLTAASEPDVIAVANAAKNIIYNGYPRRTGNLRKGLSVVISRQGTRTRATIRNSAPHALLFERGTQARHTKLGADRGSMPPNHIFTATVERAQRELLNGPLPKVIEQFGMKVTGSAT